ncbi:MAG: hypothetical protein AABZ60_11070 [Planctomycetota bacterium]
MQTRRYSSKPVNALQVGNPAYAMELKARQSQQRAKPMTLSSLAVDPFGVNTVQAFYPGKVRVAKKVRNPISFVEKTQNKISSSAKKSSGSCLACQSRSTKKSELSQTSSFSQSAGRQGATILGSRQGRTDSTSTEQGSDSMSLSDFPSEIDTLGQEALSNYAKLLEQQFAQMCAPPSQSNGCCSCCGKNQGENASSQNAENQQNSGTPGGSETPSEGTPSYLSIPSLINNDGLPQGVDPNIPIPGVTYTPGYNPDPLGGLFFTGGITPGISAWTQKNI